MAMSLFFFLMLLACVGLGALPPLTSSIFSPHKKYIVVPVDVLGLANRLRIIASFYAIAKSSHRSLVIIWAPSEECNIEFDELFDMSEVVAIRREIVVVSPGGPGPLDNGSILTALKTLHKELGRYMVMRYPHEFFVDTSFSTAPASSPVAVAVDLKEEYIYPTIDIITLRSASTHAPLGISCSEYSRLKMELYASLVPVTAVREMQGEAFQLLHSQWGGVTGSAQHDGPIIGVHVRRHDDGYDWAVVPPEYRDASHDEARSAGRKVDDAELSHLVEETTASPQALTFDESTPLSAIVEAMEDILNKHVCARFFVASNRNDVKEQIVAHFGGSAFDKHKCPGSPHRRNIVAALKLQSGIDGRNNVDAMQMALLELTLLGGLSDLLLHSKGSSFAAEAAFMPSLLDYYHGAPTTTTPSPTPTHASAPISTASGGSTWRRYVHGLQSPVPVIDVFAVSASSLGVKEQQGGDTDSLLLPDGRVRLNVYTMDTRLRQCGMHDFLNADAANTNRTKEVVCYKEESGLDGGGRSVCSHRLKVSMCHTFTELWGIRHLYCAAVSAAPVSNSSELKIRHFSLPESMFVMLDISGYSASESG
jgi:hypothetical protein